MTNKARFLALRLKHMSLPEALCRLRQIGTILSLKVLCKKLNAPGFSEDNLRSLILPSIHGRVSDEVVAQIIKAGGKGQDSHQAANDHADIRIVWEPARLQDIYKLLSYAEKNPSGQYRASAKAIARQRIQTWIEENPFLAGPHYLSVMECGLRVPVFIYTLTSVDGLSDQERQRIGNSIYEHAWLISRKLSLYSSLGNHTICEAIGLVFAGALFRDDDEGSRWLQRGIQILDQEICHQILDDGGPLEQSLSYHRFILDLYWMAAGFLEKNGLHECSRWEELLLKGEEFLGAFAGQQGELPSIGDSDDGAAVAPGLAPERVFAKDCSPSPRPSPARGEGDRVFGDGNGYTSRSFCRAGYTIISGPGEMRLIFDHGPLGMPPLFNHGHADALSIILSKGGKPLLVDPGTFRYNGVPEWRRYFKGTRAHNTVTVDGLDQAVQETSFIWSHSYTVDEYAMSETPEGAVIQARHNGYTRLREPVWHTRAVRTENGRCTVIDTFSGSGVHDFELNFHIHPDAEVVPNGSSWTVRNGGAQCVISLAGNDNLQLFHGQTDPPYGWYSPAYGKKVEAGVLSCRKRGRPEKISFTTEIAI